MADVALLSDRVQRVSWRLKNGRTVVTVLALCALQASAAVAGEPATGPAGYLAQVLDLEARIYESRDPFSATLKLAAGGETFGVRARSGAWVQVCLPDGRTGWIVGRHLSVGPARRPGSIGPIPGTRRELLGAWAGALAGQAVTAGLAVALLAMHDPFGGMFEEVHGSGAVSRTTLGLTLGAAAAASLLTPFAAARGTQLAADKDRPPGNLWTSWWASAVGSVVGSGIGYGLDMLVQTGGAFTALVGTIGMTTGAVAGYELSRPAYTRRYDWAERLRPPTLGVALDRSVPGGSTRVWKLNMVEAGF